MSKEALQVLIKLQHCKLNNLELELLHLQNSIANKNLLIEFNNVNSFDEIESFKIRAKIKYLSRKIKLMQEWIAGLEEDFKLIK